MPSTDVVVHGPRPADQAEAQLAAEVSSSISGVDAARAVRRSGTVARATGLPVVAVVAGERIHPEAHRTTRVPGLRRVLDGVALAPTQLTPPDRVVRG